MKPAISKGISFLLLIALVPCLVLFSYPVPLSECGPHPSLVSLDVCDNHDIQSAGIAYALPVFSLLILFFLTIHRLSESSVQTHLSILSCPVEKPPAA